MELLDVMKNLSIQNETTDANAPRLFKSRAVDIDDVPTEVVIAEYVDRSLLIASQYGKIGSLLLVTKDQAHSPFGSNDIYTTKVIFGATGEQQQVAARFLAEALKIEKSLCIFINLKAYDIETVKAIRDLILDLKQEEN